MTKMRPTEVKLNSAPEDWISTVRFGPKSNQYLIASSWDGTVRFYDVMNNAVRQKFVQDAPVLDVTFMVSITIELNGPNGNAYFHFCRM